jgi:hypothetical protein
MKHEIKKDRGPVKVNLIYHKPKNEEEAKEQQRIEDQAFETFFTLMLGKDWEYMVPYKNDITVPPDNKDQS